jgi:GT2 family glycosyltransferase
VFTLGEHSCFVCHPSILFILDQQRLGISGAVNVAAKAVTAATKYTYHIIENDRYRSEPDFH